MEETTKTYGFTGNLAAKVGAFILAVILFVLTVGGCLGAFAMLENDFYTVPEEQAVESVLGSAVTSYQYEFGRIYDSYLKNEEDESNYRYGVSEMRRVMKSTNIIGVSISDAAGELLYSYSDVAGTTLYRNPSAYGYCFETTVGYPGNWYSVEVYLAKEFTAGDTFSQLANLVHLACSLRYAVYPIVIISAILLVVTVVFLLVSSGRHKGENKPRAGWGTAVPFDILTAAVASAVMLMIGFIIEYCYSNSGWLFAVLTAAAVIVGFMLVLGWMMSFAVRIKLGKWWKNTLIYRILRLIWHILRAIGRGFAALFRAIPSVWRTVVIYAVASLLVLVFMEGSLYRTDFGTILFVWFAVNFFLFPVVLYTATAVRKTGKNISRIADGHLDAKTDKKYLIGEFRRQANELDRVGEGMTKAVDERMKSERMKTELITNVSHDLKTPLTSIINYADLINREECDNPKIREYSEVLRRQSERLKRLISDLVEASKAATGNLEVSLVPLEVGVLLIQAEGEFEERLRAAGLEPIVRRPSMPVYIMADGRRLWRVFDNLLSNIIKYSMPSTRVWLTLEQSGNQAVVSFRNISREPLDISPDELLERFTRGDASRNSEGNGLGLSIAKSLTELQNGKLSLTVDGDLFKVTLRFPVVEAPKKEVVPVDDGYVVSSQDNAYSSQSDVGSSRDNAYSSQPDVVSSQDNAYSSQPDADSSHDNAVSSQETGGAAEVSE